MKEFQSLYAFHSIHSIQGTNHNILAYTNCPLYTRMYSLSTLEDFVTIHSLLWNPHLATPDIENTIFFLFLGFLQVKLNQLEKGQGRKGGGGGGWFFCVSTYIFSKLVYNVRKSWGMIMHKMPYYLFLLVHRNKIWHQSL